MLEPKIIRESLIILGVAFILAGIMLPTYHRAFAIENDTRKITIDASDYHADWRNVSVTITDLNIKMVVFKGYTPVDFSALSNHKYQVSIAGGYGTQLYFDHWSDLLNYQADTLGATGDETGPLLRSPRVPFRYVPGDGNSYDLSAVYRTWEFPGSSSAPLKVNAVDQNGKELPGMYMVIYACSNTQNTNSVAQLTNCYVASSGWTPYPDGMFSYWPYYVSPISWHTNNPSDTGGPKAYVFDHWENGSTGLLPAGSPPTTLTAVYTVLN